MTYLSALACNILNNQPMTILFARVLQHKAFDVSPLVLKSSTFGLILGSNFGANFTVIGALAGIMWIQILHDKNIPVSYFQFAKIGFVVMPSVIFVASSVLAIELAINS